MYLNQCWRPRACKPIGCVCFALKRFLFLRLDEVQSENMKLKVENAKLSRRVDTIKNENQNISWIEQEKDSLKQNVAQMKATIENLQKSQSKQVRSLNFKMLYHTSRAESWLAMRLFTVDTY